MDIYHVLKEAKAWGETVDADRNNMTNLSLAGWQCLVEYAHTLTWDSKIMLTGNPRRMEQP